MSILSEIEDYYYSKGFHGKTLENVLKSDKKYRQELKKKRNKTKKFHKMATRKEMQKYPLLVKEDFVILYLVKKVKKKKLEARIKKLLN